MKSNRPEILELIRDVEKVAQRKIRSSSDFFYLSGCIMTRCNQSLSVATLKRIWGYVDGYEDVRFSTLSILARYVGYKDWEDYLEYLSEKTDVQSNEVLSEYIRVEDLKVGDKIEFGWRPNRRCLIQYEGNKKFRVLESENAKLLPGDTFNASIMIKDEPLYIDNLVQNGEAPKLFIVGKAGGLTLIEKCKD